MAQQNITLKARGLYTFPNALSEVPDGALAEATNVVIDRDGIINPRRGFKVYGNSFGTGSSRSKQLLLYKGRILRHWSNELDVDSDDAGTFTPMLDSNGDTAVVTEVETGTRIKYIEANGNLYFTTSSGIKKISCLDVSTLPSEPVTQAGGVKALDSYAVLNPATGWFTQDSTVAYRVVWGIKDNNTNVILGVPSERVVITNPLVNLLINDFNTLVADLAAVAAVAPLVRTGDTTNTSTTVANVTTTNLSPGMTVSGAGIPANTTIVTVGTTSITISNAATATATGVSLTFGQKLHDTDYASLKLSINSSPVVLYTALKSLANGSMNKLDTDLGDQSQQVTSIAAIAGSSFRSSDVSDYFDIYSALNATQYRVWFQSGSSIAPDATNVTLVQVNVGSGDADTAIAGKISVALDDTGDFTTSVSSNTVTVTNIGMGLSLAPVTSVLSSSFTATVTTFGVTPAFGSIPLTPATSPSNPATTDQLTQMQTYFDNIVNALNITTGISTYAKQAIGGAFQNSTQSATANVYFTIPEVITTAYFYQIYRSALFQSTGASTIDDVTPDDELRLIFESNPTSAELSAKQINFYDNIPDAFRQGGANLYTNANSGEGIDQANEVPPLSKDIAQFKNSTFYANTQTLYNTEIGLLTAVGLAGGQLTTAQGSVSNTYTFVEEVNQVTDITCIAGNLFTSSGTADYFDIYSADSATQYRVWFSVGSAVAPSGTGVTLVPCTISGSDSASDVATKLATALTGIQDFVSSSSSAVVTVINENTGPTMAPVSHVANGSFTLVVTTQGSGEDAANLKIGVSNAATPAQEVDATARSIVRVINKNPNETIYAYYVSGPDDIPGLIRLEARSLGDPNFYIAANSTTISQKFNPDLKTMTAITDISVANPTVITATGHGLTTGQQILISGSNSTPSIDGIRTVTVTSADTFTIPVNVTNSGNAGGFVLLSNAANGDNEVVPNRLYYSKFQQPEAVPIVNYQDVGPKNKKILRILPLRNSLFILSEAGVYILTGDDVDNFQISLFDASTQLKATDSAVVLNNQIYMFSSQGVATISDTGTSVISRPIENLLLPLVTSAYTHFVSSTFAVGYESDRAYILFTIVETTDTVATVAYRYNMFTNTWVSWDISKTCAVINTEQDLLYLGAGDLNSIEQERKSFTRLDHADRENILNVPTSGISGTILSLGSLFGSVAGDVFVQTQYLTVAQLNRLLRRLDTDAGLNQKDYYSTLQVSAGFDLRNSLTLLAAKLDTDSGLASHNFASSISGYGNTFQDTQDAFNVIVNLLNTDANTKVKTYSTSTGTVQYEVPVSAVNTSTTKITLSYAVPFIAGEVTQYIAIPSTVTWAPHHFGDASMTKHVSETTLLFETMDFTSATASYASDLSPGFDAVPVMGEGTGIWGGFEWGEIFFGGEGSSRPFRTLVPPNKQRCRYINGKFAHAAAFEKYAIYGISYTYSAISSRGYR